MLRALTVTFLATACSASLFASDYTLLATPSTVAWGYYSGSSKPVMTVHSGDTVRMQTLSTCGPPDRLMQGRGPYRELVTREMGRLATHAAA